MSNALSWLYRRADRIACELMHSAAFLTLVGITMGAMQCAERFV